MIFGIKQIIKMLFQQLILPVVYNACTAKPVIPGTVILADAHHDEIPFSMLAIKEELSRHIGSGRHCRIAELAAIISSCGRMGHFSHGNELRILDERPVVISDIT